MDLLDSLDCRIRSWYLYEQYKSLEESQLCAARELKSRSNEQKYLSQQLSERRARRCLYEQADSCGNYSSSCLHKNLNSIENSRTSSTEKFCDSFSELPENLDDDNAKYVENNFDDNVIEPDETILDEWSSKDSVIKSDRGLSDCSSTEYDDDKETINITSSKVLEPKEIDDNIDELREDLTFAKRHIEENIHLQIENVKENIATLNEFKKLCEEDKLSDILSLDSYGNINVKKVNALKKCAKHDNTLIIVWSKLMSFAYQVLQLNHGECYNDISSELLTALLACNVFLRGVSKMCHILQPYVSPVKFDTDDELLRNKQKNATLIRNGTKKHRQKVDTKIHTLLLPQRMCKQYRSLRRNVQLKNKHDCRYRLCQKMRNNLKRASDSLPALHVDTNKNVYDSSMNTSSHWMSFDALCGCADDNGRVDNPMLKLVKYIDESMISENNLQKRI